MDEISLQWGYKGKVQQMVEKMKDLAAVMHDADDKSRRGEENGEAAGRWLTKLKSVAYDIEDVLDDLEAPNSQPKFHKLITRIISSHKLDEVWKKIEELENEKMLTLKLVARREARPDGSRNNETFAAINATGMMGRDHEKEKIINLLFNREAAEDISIIPIVGLGGIGKTTLAQSVYTDEKVKSLFDIQAWVYVSKEFSLKDIGFAIMKSIDSKISLDKWHSQLLHDNLQKGLATTRYLVVLDDLWEEDGQKLEDLKCMLQYGLKGSKIIVTTQNLSVVKKLCVGTLANNRKVCPVTESINLDILAPKHCWEVMKQKALGPYDQGRSDLEEIGIQIAQNCGGLPLLLSALGQVMSESRNVRRWENIRDTKFDLSLGDEHQKKILECLMPSYYYMKVDFKMCFTYLAAFPRGSVMNTHRLIQQWDALGYIPPGYDGQICIDYLLGMSFLQMSGSDSVSPNSMHAEAPRKVIMHDLVHELVSVITANEFVILDANAAIPRNWKSAIHCRHAQLINYKKQPCVFKDLPGCSSIVELEQLTCKELQVLQLKNVRNAEEAERAKLRDKTDLQRLYFSFGLQGEEDKSVLERLIPPRTLQTFYLNQYMSKDFLAWMSDVSFYLPSLTLVKLSGLRTCDNLPPLGQLPNLRSLVLVHIPNLRKIGKEFYGKVGGTCTKLRFIRLTSMENVVELWTTLSGEGNEEPLIPNLHSLEIKDCPKLKFLPYPPRSMFWQLTNSNMVLPKRGFGELSSSALPFHMVVSNCKFAPEKWNRFQHLPTLEIFLVNDCNGLRVFPEAMRCLTSLTKLCLWSMKDLERLPEWLGNLTSLEKISIKDCPAVTYLPESIKSLPALRILWLTECNGLNALPEWMGQLISLQEFYIVRCHNLTSLPESTRNLGALKKLYIWGCPNLVERCQGEDAHMISHIPDVILQGNTIEHSSTSGDAGGSTSGDAGASTSGHGGGSTS